MAKKSQFFFFFSTVFFFIPPRVSAQGFFSCISSKATVSCGTRAIRTPSFGYYLVPKQRSEGFLCKLRVESWVESWDLRVEHLIRGLWSPFSEMSICFAQFSHLPSELFVKLHPHLNPVPNFLSHALSYVLGGKKVVVKATGLVNRAESFRRHFQANRLVKRLRVERFRKYIGRKCSGWFFGRVLLRLRVSVENEGVIK